MPPKKVPGAQVPVVVELDYDDLPDEHKPILPPKALPVATLASNRFRSTRELWSEPDQIQLKLHQQIMSRSFNNLGGCVAASPVRAFKQSSSKDWQGSKSGPKVHGDGRPLMVTEADAIMDYDEPISHVSALHCQQDYDEPIGIKTRHSMTGAGSISPT